MFTLLLDDETAKKLQAISMRENRPLNEIVSAAIAQYDAPQPIGNPNWLKQIAARANKHTDLVWKDEPDLSERSREILDNEFADYLLNRTEHTNDE